MILASGGGRWNFGNEVCIIPKICKDTDYKFKVSLFRIISHL